MPCVRERKREQARSTLRREFIVAEQIYSLLRLLGVNCSFSSQDGTRCLLTLQFFKERSNLSPSLTIPASCGSSDAKRTCVFVWERERECTNWLLCLNVFICILGKCCQMCESDVDRYGIILDNTFVSTVTHNTDTKTKMLGARYSRKQMQPTIFLEAKRVVRQHFFFSFTFFLSLSLFHIQTHKTLTMASTIWENVPKIGLAWHVSF